MKIPRGIRNNNPLNIRKGNDWQGERHPQTDKEFEEFESLTMGFRAAFKLLKNYMNGNNGRRQVCDNLEKIIHRREKLWFNDRDKMCRIVQAMAIVECGVRIDLSTIESGYDLV